MQIHDNLRELSDVVSELSADITFNGKRTERGEELAEHISQLARLSLMAYNDLPVIDTEADVLPPDWVESIPS